MAQSDFEALLEAGAEDASALTKGYLSPMLTSVGFGLVSGWNNTARTHQKWGFDISISGGFLSIPTDEYYYRTDNIGLMNTVQINGTEAPTIFGPDGEENRPEYRFRDPDTGDVADFTGPEGIDLPQAMDDIFGIRKSFLPVPMIQFGLGLPTSTDIRFRFVPKIRVGEDTRFNIWGIGFQHNLMQYLSNEPKFDLSAFVGYTHVGVESDLRSAEITTDNDVISSDGRGLVSLNSWSVLGMISRDVSVFTFYSQLGYNFVSSRTRVEGTFSYESGGELKSSTDPVDFNLTSSGPRFTLGMRVKLWAITLHSSYSFQKYNALELGFGFSVN
jgi:hypothetical protein